MDQLLIDADDAAAICGISERSWRRLQMACRGPLPIRLTPRLVRWNHAEVKAWIAAGCPDRLSCDEQQEDDDGERPAPGVDPSDGRR